MKTRFSLGLPAVSACALALVVAFAGCRKDPPAPLPADQIPAALGAAFKGADAATRAEADAAAAAVRNDEQAQSMETLERLSRRPDLSPEQREATTRAAMGVRRKILDAAAAGDQAAKDFLQQQAARK